MMVLVENTNINFYIQKLKIERLCRIIYVLYVIMQE